MATNQSDLNQEISKDLVIALNNVVLDCHWQLIGNSDQFQRSKCYKLYNLEDLNEDLILIRDKNGKFYAMDSRCSHEGGPLEQGDIEELHEKTYLVCPWHSFEFELNTGVSSTGLKQQTYEVRLDKENDSVYVNIPCKLSLKQSDVQAACNLEKTNSETIVTNEENDTSLLSYWACQVLNTPDPKEKVKLTHLIADKWKRNELRINASNESQPPDQPKRLDTLNIVDPAKIRRGKGGTLASRMALLHSLANIEQWAIDLSWDIIARFCKTTFPDKTVLPQEFYSDFIKVACDEAKHFSMLDERLVELGSSFGSFPVHNGLWESATVTKHDLLARLAIVHMVHEARGLDVHPQTRCRFHEQKDEKSVELLDTLYRDEITHVEAGLRWFQYGCQKYDYNSIETFHSLVKQFFKGYLKPPFNTEGRQSAGMTPEWYLPLVKSS